jgi:23S rRNA G2069 N7-methylase RlmK/C1962 C5-methylase RlmI
MARKSKQTMSKIDEKLAQAKARLEAAKAALTDDDRAEISGRDEIAKIEAEAKAEEIRKRDLDLDRRLDAARAELGEKAGLEAVAIESFPDTFIVQRNSKAHAKWADDIAKASQSGKGDRAAINRAYAVSGIYDWNGVIGGEDSEFTHKLAKYLTENPGMVTPITNALANLAGVFASDRKS